jgi:hypothetical protein
VRRFHLIPVALASFFVAVSLAQDESEEEQAEPDIVAFMMTDGSATSKEVETIVGKIRGAYEEKPVLFLNVNLATVGGRHQAQLLFGALGVGPAWPECKKAAGNLVLVSLAPLEVLAKLGPKDDIAKAIDEQLAPPAEEESGCGCGEDG